MGWIGNARQLESVLMTINADKDEHGKIIVYGSAPISFMGMGEEFVVSDDCECSIGGKRVNLACLLNSTSYGTAVTVF